MTGILVVSAAVVLCLSSVTQAATYATNVTAGSIHSSTALLTWLAPDDLASGADSYRLTVLDEQSAVVVSVAIGDVASTSYEVAGLAFSTWHNVTLETLDAAGSAIGSEAHTFLTSYDPVNLRALCAIAIVAALLLILVFMKVAAKVCNPDKAAAKWKQEILVTKQREREERKMKLSAQGGAASKTGLELV